MFGVMVTKGVRVLVCWSELIVRQRGGILQADEELELLALEGLNSGHPIEVTSEYWAEQHRRLDERLKKTGIQ
jgi:hypothetical protein